MSEQAPINPVVEQQSVEAWHNNPDATYDEMPTHELVGRLNEAQILGDRTMAYDGPEGQSPLVEAVAKRLSAEDTGILELAQILGDSELDNAEITQKLASEAINKQLVKQHNKNLGKSSMEDGAYATDRLRQALTKYKDDYKDKEIVRRKLANGNDDDSKRNNQNNTANVDGANFTDKTPTEKLDVKEGFHTLNREAKPDNQAGEESQGQADEAQAVDDSEDRAADARSQVDQIHEDDNAETSEENQTVRRLALDGTHVGRDGLYDHEREEQLQDDLNNPDDDSPIARVRLNGDRVTKKHKTPGESRFSRLKSKTAERKVTKRIQKIVKGVKKVFTIPEHYE